jgi:hypothetical protein
MKKTVLIVFLLSVFKSKSQTIVPDMTSVSGNWTLSGSPYIIQGRATVPTGQTLTIAPGVQVKFASQTDIYNSAIWSPDTNAVGSLRVNGGIIAVGNATDTIAFIANGSGYWGSLFITNDTNSGSAFSYCKFKNMYQLYGYNSSLGVTEGYNGLSYPSNINFSLLHNLFEDNQWSLTLGGSSYLQLKIGYSVFKNNVDSFSKPIPASTFIERGYIYNCVFDNSIICGSDLIIVNSIFKNSAGTAIYHSSFAPPTCKIINSIFYNNGKPFTGAYDVGIFNSIFMNNVDYDTACGYCNWKLNNSVFDGPIKGTWITNTFNYQNTNLVSPINGNFHLLSSSICINSGDTTGISTSIPSIDLDENPRYLGVIDIGPYEFNPNNSINQFELSNSKVYPNPATDKLYIETKEEDIKEIKLYDVLGKEQLSTTKKEMDISSLSNGVYFITVRANESFFSKKIIVQH